MLAKLNRVSVAETRFVLQKGSLVNGRLFSLLVYNLKDRRPPRLGFIISSKVCKKAVGRNKLKRLLRESLKPFLAQIPLGMIILFLGKRKAVGKSFSEISDEVEKIFKKSQLISP